MSKVWSKPGKTENNYRTIIGNKFIFSSLHLSILTANLKITPCLGVLKKYERSLKNRSVLVQEIKNQEKRVKRKPSRGTFVLMCFSMF